MNTHLSTSALPADQRDLVARIAHGEHRALRTAYNEHAGTAMAVALRVLGSRPDAEAIVLETFQEVWRHARDQEPGSCHLAAWIASIARRKARERLGSRMPTRPSPNDDDDGSPQPLPLESTLRRRERRHVAAVLVCLPEDERKVLEMAWFSCMSLADIAARLDEPVPVVQAALASAMERLADLLQQAPERSA